MPVSITKRQFAKNTLLANVGLLTTESPKVFRKVCLDKILAKFPDTSPGSLGAVYNDAKHLLINAGEIEAFGRHGAGRNHNSAPKIEMPEGSKWKVVTKEGDHLVSYHPTKAKATASITDKTLHKVVKLEA